MRFLLLALALTSTAAHAATYRVSGTFLDEQLSRKIPAKLIVTVEGDRGSATLVAPGARCPLHLGLANETGHDLFAWHNPTLTYWSNDDLAVRTSDPCRHSNRSSVYVEITVDDRGRVTGGEITESWSSGSARHRSHHHVTRFASQWNQE